MGLGISMKQRFFRAVLCEVAASVSLFINMDGAAGRDVERRFGATAEASGMYVRYGIPGFLLVDNYIDGGGPVAQAQLGSDENSKAFASLPYPGSTALAYPAVAALVLGLVPPGYPLYVAASHPTQPAASERDPSGTYSLTAEAEGAKSAGDARVLGPAEKPASGSQATSRVEAHDGRVAANAFSTVKGLSIGPLSV